ncbi:MAG: hypothetical protein UU16_C0017G0007 [Candidatus Woesebacteria bacterium GW2011_GWA2_40_7]|uniref:Uncharacterized protein n=3 Tax=Candidatus Woeseibacteriota TaxID=1752722 RepID=A0A0G0UYM2_9BACT|nr:MAG: hypothetical protein UT17_C0002G0038 [Candidatus Woesebacteria bacterium GW2011_GWB1_39_10]KKR73631.1 MAG: hypothetical protein UU16_C0017G0007 [Candidatus Woesebacteria bacterium GW2011_GWA2_40_7]KKR92611.1 MAG: hypothetical protein UU42_C0001G0215 [Candidatus Woesebacteria bacterium GW2011_GWA1_41_13b]
MRETEIQNTTASKVVTTVDAVIHDAIKTSPPIDKKRGDLIRGETYYLTGGDPDKRNQI